MRLKRFSAGSLRDAMEQVRASLGDDAIILATEEAKDGRVCVTAALDNEPAELPVTVPSTKTEATAFPTSDPAHHHGILTLLDHHGFPNKLAHQISSRASQTPQSDLQEDLGPALTSTFTFASVAPEAQGDSFFLAGLPGAGKSAVAAKLAAAARLAGRPCTIVTLDGKKSGGLAQMTAFTEALGAELEVARTLSDLRRTVQQAPKEGRLVVDDSGRNPFDPENAEHLRLTLENLDLRCVLVMAAGGDLLDSIDMARAFADLGLKEAIISKADLTRRMGSAIGAAHAAGLHIAGLSASPHIGEAVQDLSATTLANALMKGSDSVSRSSLTPSVPERKSQWKQ
ncbi:MAG: hypothetical protein AAF530_05045 [Pseudomonadota bacterium]